MADATGDHPASSRDRSRADGPEGARTALSVAQAARSCGLSERTLRTYIATGHLRVARVGRRVLVRPERLDEFLRSLESGGSA